jgi:acetyltransferase-like isoleucine patch superfamily enzyme
MIPTSAALINKKISLKNRLKRYIVDHPQIAHLAISMYNHLFGGNRLFLRSNRLSIGAAMLQRSKIDIHGKNNTVVISNMCRLRHCRIYICGNNNVITIAKNVSLYQAELWIENDDNEIYIGENSSISGETQLAAIESTKIIIGDDCMFSGNIAFRTGDSHSIIDMSGKRINASKSIRIGNHVWIGTRVIVLKGSVVGDHCIVGAGTTLSGEFDESNSIIVGNPARIVKRGCDWLRQRIPVEDL